jgi:cell division GTPase FtsZ
MQVVMVGLGGGGSRLVDHFYENDLRSGTIRCINAIAVDKDAKTLEELKFIPADQKLYFHPLSLTYHEEYTSTVVPEEVISRLQSIDTGEVDAIVLCGGLGGALLDDVTRLVAHIRSAMIEPVFGLFTLPCNAEGGAVLARAGAQIRALKPVLDGMILFDNEFWYPRVREKVVLQQETAAQQHRIAFPKAAVPVDSRLMAYRELNSLIVRRIGLLFRAGEFSDKSGSENAEVVLDAGEVLNTIKRMGFITVGYAIEPVVHAGVDLSPLTLLRPSSVSVDEAYKKASMMIDLAKRAVNEENSIPCDPSSAQNALVLIAGPTQEMSMKGYMTIRKWIDRTVSGEVRAGDYPVKNSRFLAVVVVLAGVGKIPRVEELYSFADQPETSGIYPLHDTAKDTVIAPPEKDEEGLSVPGSPEPAGEE